jgi:hypothetical protein
MPDMFLSNKIPARNRHAEIPASAILPEKKNRRSVQLPHFKKDKAGTTRKEFFVLLFQSLHFFRSISPAEKTSGPAYLNSTHTPRWSLAWSEGGESRIPMGGLRPRRFFSVLFRKRWSKEW